LVPTVDRADGGVGGAKPKMVVAAKDVIWDYLRQELALMDLC